MLTLSGCSNNNNGGGRAPLQVCGVSGPLRREPCVSLSHFSAGLVAAARLRSRWGSRRLADCAVRPVVACRVCPPKTELKVGFAPGGRPGPQRAHRGRPSAGAPRVSACVGECACVSVCVRGGGERREGSNARALHIWRLGLRKAKLSPGCSLLSSHCAALHPGVLTDGAPTSLLPLPSPSRRASLHCAAHPSPPPPWCVSASPSHEGMSGAHVAL